MVQAWYKILLHWDVHNNSVPPWSKTLLERSIVIFLIRKFHAVCNPKVYCCVQKSLPLVPVHMCPYSQNCVFPIRSLHKMRYAMCHDSTLPTPVRWGTTLCSKWMTAVHFIRPQTQFVIDKLFTLDEARNPFPYILVQIHLLSQRICYA